MGVFIVSSELNDLALSAATTLVGTMATDAWSRAKSAFGDFWTRVRPQQAERAAADLADAESTVSAARRRGDQDAEDAVLAEWQGRLRGLLGLDPAAAEQLRALLGTLTPTASVPTTRISMRADARGHGRNYQSAGDMEIHE